jgi:hypothetical protein
MDTITDQLAALLVPLGFEQRRYKHTTPAMMGTFRWIEESVSTGTEFVKYDTPPLLTCKIGVDDGGYVSWPCACRPSDFAFFGPIMVEIGKILTATQSGSGGRAMRK